MIISLHSNGHWIMTFHEDLLNRVLGTEVCKKKGRVGWQIPAPHSFLIENCCEFIIVLIVQTLSSDVDHTPRGQNEAVFFVLLVTSKLI